MKKIFAIALLAVHLFNITGYNLVFNYFIHQSDHTVIHQLDRSIYNEAELVEVKIPLHLPYMNDMNKYERCDGNIEFNGFHYNYVKRRLHSDTLYILCLPNNVKTQLYAEKTSYAKKVNDIPVNNKSPLSFMKKGIYSGEYKHPNQSFCFDSYFLIIQSATPFIVSKLSAVFIPTQAEPPEHNC